ncbi:MAG: hypothetical protein EON98_08165 [Chitinophagaceae bacterium]|nr:MAG: hypothetical protein EON98_08165 [Chitinophagaceae bacterium]
MSRKLLLIILIPALLLIGGYLFLRISLSRTIKKEEAVSGKVETIDSLGGKEVSAADLRPLFINRMQQVLRKSSNGLYDLSIGDLELDVLASTITLKDVAVKRNERAEEALRKQNDLPENLIEASFKSLVIDGVNLDDAITSKTMDYRMVKLVNPVIHVYKGQKQPTKKSTEDFSQRFLKEMEKLSIKNLVIENGTIVAHGKASKTNRLNDVDIHMTDILLDSNTREDQQRFLFAKNATINFRNYTSQTADGLYQFKIGKGSIQSPAQKLVLQDLSFASPLSREQFMKRQKLAKELYDFRLSSISLNKVDWWMLFNGEEIVADEVMASGGKLTVYFDRSLPPRSRMGNFPNQLLAKLPFRMNIAKMRLQNLDLSYTEYSPVSKQNGTIYMDNISLDMQNISNYTKKSMVVNGSALFMHTVPIQANFNFNMTAPKTGAFTATVSSSKAFEGNLLNSFSKPLGLMELEKGTLQKLHATLKGDESQANGTVTVLYNDLKIHLLEKDKGKKALDTKDVTSFLANLFVIKNDNPKKGKAPRVETASFRRDPYGGFFMLIWKTMLVGALKTMGAPEKIAYKKPKAQ